MKKMLAYLLVLSILLGSLACAAPATTSSDFKGSAPNENAASPAAEEQPAKGDLTFGAVCISLGAPIWVELMTAGDAAAATYGGRVIWKSAEGKLENQIALVESFVEQGVDAILIDPIDAVGIIPAVNTALEAEIPVITMGNFVKGGIDDATYNVSTCYPDTRDVSAMTELLIAIGGEGTYGGIMGTTGNFVSDTRRSAFVATCEALGVNYTVAAGNWDPTTTLKATEDMVAAYKDLKGIYNLDDSMGIISLQAMPAGMSLAGHNGEMVALEKIDNGEMICTILTGGYRMGDWNVETAYRLASGEKLDPQVFMKTYIVMSEETKKIYIDAGIANKYPELEVVSTDEARKIATFDGKYGK